MKWNDWLENGKLTSLKFNAGFLALEFKPQDEDKNAAWEMYIELLTRITTQPLAQESGDEKTALDSIYTLFAITREVIKRNGRGCIEFTRIAIVILNQKVRPFTAKWHKESLAGAFDNINKCKEFRIELKELQRILVIYTEILANMAGIEDLKIVE